MTTYYPNPALDAELAYRREQLVAAYRAGNRHGSWTSRRRRTK